jgi:hypothetical protein
MVVPYFLNAHAQRGEEQKRFSLTLKGFKIKMEKQTKKQRNEIIDVILNDLETLNIDLAEGDNKYYFDLIKGNLEDLKNYSKKVKYKVKIETEEETERTLYLILNEESLEHLKNEMEGLNATMWEYKTTEGEILNDFMIKRIISIKKYKGGKNKKWKKKKEKSF